MKGTPSSERIVASNGFSERQSGLPNPTRHAFVPVSTVEGPWAFALPLPPTGDIASASPSLPSATPMDRHVFFNGAFYHEQVCLIETSGCAVCPAFPCGRGRQ